MENGPCFKIFAGNAPRYNKRGTNCPAVTDLSNELKANNTPLTMGDCAAYNSQNRDNEGQIISAANAPDVVNALLIPVFKLTQLDWADCPEVDADGESAY